MSATDRRQRIIDMLSAGLLTGETMAERLGVSIRTVYRDVAQLKADGVAVVGERAMGYMLRPSREARAK